MTEPIVVEEGHAPFQGPWMVFRTPSPCAWCHETITGPWAETPRGECYHRLCEQAASEAGRFKRITGLKDAPKAPRKQKRSA